jgi:hypothetical protein
MVPKKGLEPPRRCRHMDLNHARLPIPPLRLIALRTSERSQKVSLQKSGRLSTPTFIVQRVPLLSNLRARTDMQSVQSGQTYCAVMFKGVL